MSDGVPKSRVTLTYDTKQPEGRQKPRELPFRLMVLGDLGGAKDTSFDKRRPRQLNGRNLGEVIKGLKVRIEGVPLDEDGDRKVNVLIDRMSAFAPDEVLELVTGQKAQRADVDPILQRAWGDGATAQQLWAGDAQLAAAWAKREEIVGFQKSYQNSKTLRTALKPFSAPPADDAEKTKRLAAMKKMRSEIAKKLGSAGPGGSPAAGSATPTGGGAAPPTSGGAT